MKTDMEIGELYHLGDGENYFVYREDKYNPDTLRADLFNVKGNNIYTTLVKGGMINADKTHFDVINEMEIISLKIIY